jgi:hypothetical protein
MGAVETKVQTRRFACQSRRCNCWKEYTTAVMIDYDSVRTWNDLRCVVAQRMQLPPMRVAVYEQPWQRVLEQDHPFSDGVEVDYMRQIDPAHGALYAQERERE